MTTPKHAQLHLRSSRTPEQAASLAEELKAQGFTTKVERWADIVVPYLNADNSTGSVPDYRVLYWYD